MNIVDELHAIAAALATAEIVYAVCGGIAVTAHGVVRTTKDIDVVVRREDLAKALEVVRPLGYTFAALPMTFDEGTPRERHVQRVSKLAGTEHLLLDLLLEEAAIAGALEDRVVVDLPGGSLAIVSRATLIRMSVSRVARKTSPTSRSWSRQMASDLEPRQVAERLARLRVLYVPETLDEARRRLVAERPAEPFAAAVARRLAELRALDELTRYLHRALTP